MKINCLFLLNKCLSKTADDCKIDDCESGGLVSCSGSQCIVIIGFDK